MSKTRRELYKETPQVSNAALIRRLLGLAWRYRSGCVHVMLLQVGLLTITLSGLSLMGLGIDTIYHHVNPAAQKAPQWPFSLQPPDAWTTMHKLLLVAGLMLLLALIRTSFQFAIQMRQAHLVQAMVVQLRSDVYNKLQRLSFRFFDVNETGSIINRVSGDTQRVRQFVDGVIIQLFMLVLTLTVFLVYMLNINVKLTLVCLATTPVLWLLSIIYSRKIRPEHVKNRALYDKMVLRLSENIQGHHVVKGFALEDDEIAKFAGANRAVRDQQGAIFRWASLFPSLITLVTQVNTFILLCYGGYLIAVKPIGDPESISVGTLIVFANLLSQFSNQVGNVAGLANTVQQSLTSAQRVFEVLDAPLEIQNKPGAKRLPKAAGHVRFENVTFAYNHDDPVLEEIDLEVEPGQCVAVLGTTGSGKSTLLSLISRFYDPTGGRVTIDGIDVRDIDLDDLRRNVGLVFQESFLFSNTVAANIAFGHPEATQEQIEHAARIAAAHEFITELPLGYKNLVGEYGSNLSGGQRQRLAIARAVLLEPAILLLDDATAAIDPETEHEILQAMDNAMQGRTTFVVAHRLSTLRRADFVIVLEKGRIVQRGTHDELMNASGHYRKTAKLQLADDESKRLLGMPQGQ